tara:strand:+ start:160 stop:297 length:138 start_codon:yes stop_codon:yes gene_type:complete
MEKLVEKIKLTDRPLAKQASPSLDQVTEKRNQHVIFQSPSAFFTP